MKDYMLRLSIFTLASAQATVALLFSIVAWSTELGDNVATTASVFAVISAVAACRIWSTRP